MRGLKAKIAISITLFLLLGMFSIDLVTMMTAQNTLIRSEAAKGQSIAWMMGEFLVGHPPWADQDLPAESRSKIRAAMDESGALSFLLIDRSGRQFSFGDHRLPAVEEVVEITRRALYEAERSVDFTGSTFGLFWWQKKFLVVSTPLIVDGTAQGAFSLVFPMQGIYQSLRHSQQVLFLYIFLNTAILSFLGIYRVFKLYLQPLARLAKRAEDYKEDDEIVFAVRKEDNELQRLSSALNALMRRLSADKETLRQTVSSLEKANAELKRAQTEMIRAEKLASVGRLSAGIAHEIGNPIGIVTGYLELLKQADLSPAERVEYMERAQREIDRISTIIRQLLEISRPSPAGSHQVSVHSLLKDMAEVLNVQPFMSHVRFSLRLDASDDSVVADTNQLRQVFLNLIINAADAISARNDGTPGELVVATENRGGDGAPGGNGKSVLLVRFSDNGTGIAEQNLRDVFDPFFTTKEPGKGTGLGLSVSFMIVESFGGRMEVDSTVGQGTTMTVVMPVGPSAGRPVSRSSDRRADGPTG
jgi:signal transduction histidine kinase